MLLQDEDLGIAKCGPVFITMLYAPPTVDRIERIAVVQRLEMKTSKHAVLTIIDPRVGKEMHADARHHAKKVSNEMEPFTLCMSFVVIGTGFFAAMVRSVVAGIQLLTNQKHPWKVNSGLEEGVRFCLDQLAVNGKACDPAELQEAATAVISGGRKENAA